METFEEFFSLINKVEIEPVSLADMALAVFILQKIEGAPSIVREKIHKTKMDLLGTISQICKEQEHA